MTQEQYRSHCWRCRTSRWCICGFVAEIERAELLRLALRWPTKPANCFGVRG